MLTQRYIDNNLMLIGFFLSNLQGFFVPQT